MPYRVYVIRLKPEVSSKKKFALANPDHRPDKPCVYVGSTALTPEERYARHVSGHRANSYVKQFHVCLHKRLTAAQPEFDTRAKAEAHERLLAERLRKRGYAVWSN